jgi:hypothetical protein
MTFCHLYYISTPVRVQCLENHKTNKKNRITAPQ